jgi:CRISPR-associated endonuclease/helicase Cas3
MRTTYALGLRTLTLQTGRSYRKDLHLKEDELAILVGGSANRTLFEFYEQKAEAHGSASMQDLIEEDSYILYEGNTVDHPLLSRALHDPNIRRLLSAPMLVCTVDHLAPATESLRAGRQIAPMLRLMSADLVLDELDDYGLDDLPALTRLVHWAGLFGTRVVLSSATLPPALIEGMFMAYRAGRMHYQRNRGNSGERRTDQAEIPCLWTDEFGNQTASCANAEAFSNMHIQFVDRRASHLAKAEPLRRAELIPLDLAPNQSTEQIRTETEFAKHVRDACLRLHVDHAETDPASGKRVSFGLVRMANIDPLFDVARTLFALGAPEDSRIHLCVYHARFPSVQRSAIENQLDTAFNRRSDVQPVYGVPAIRMAIDAYPERNHLFVVLASPVCEVGRDWDADWAIAEPSSMRSLIQLAGRVQRHRRKPGERPNLLVFDTNLRHFLPTLDRQPAAIFIRPGFEKEQAAASHPFRLAAHRLGKLMKPEEYRVLTALPRIRPLPRADWHPKQRLVDLEHARMADCMLPPSAADGAETPRPTLNATSGWRYPQAALIGVLPQQQPFRDNPMPTVTLAFLPDEDEEHLVLHRVENDRTRRGQSLYVLIDHSQRHNLTLEFGPRIAPWGNFDLMALLAEQAEHLDLPLRSCAERLATVEVPESTQKWRYHPLLGFAK